MAEGKYVISVDVQTGSAAKSITAVKDEIVKTQGAAEHLNKASGPIFGVLNDLTGGMAGKFKDMYESMGAVTKGFGVMKGAIIATGLGALLIVVGELVANWDEYKKVLQGIDAEQERVLENSRAAVELEKEKLEAFEDSTESLKRQGWTEEQITAEKLRQMDVVIEQLAQNLAMEKSLLAQRVSAEAISKAMLARVSGEKIAGLIYDPDKIAKEGEEGIKALEKNLRDLTESRDKFLNDRDKKEQEAYVKQSEDRKKAAADKKAADQKEYDELWAQLQKEQELEQQAADRRKEREEKERADAAAANQKEFDELAERLYKEQELEQQQADKLKAIEDEKLKAIEANDKKRVDMAFTAAGALLDLAATLSDGNEKAARKTFAISKALSLAQAIQGTYASVSTILKDQTYVGPTRFIAAASALTIGLANVAKIAKTKFTPSGGGDSGGGGGSISAGGGAGGGGNLQAPPIDFSGIQNRPQQQPAFQAYILPGQVSGPMEARQKIKDQSRL